MFPPYNFYWFKINTKHMAEPWLDQALMDSEYKSAVSTTTWLFNVKKYEIYNLFSRFGQLNSYKAVHADRQCTSCTYVKKLWYKINLLINVFLTIYKVFISVCLSVSMSDHNVLLKGRDFNCSLLYYCVYFENLLENQRTSFFSRKTIQINKSEKNFSFKSQNKYVLLGSKSIFNVTEKSWSYELYKKGHGFSSS